MTARRTTATANPRARLLAGLPVAERSLDLAGASTAVLEGGTDHPSSCCTGQGNPQPTGAGCCPTWSRPTTW
jgi:hypothetical protein